MTQVSNHTRHFLVAKLLPGLHHALKESVTALVLVYTKQHNHFIHSFERFKYQWTDLTLHILTDKHS